MRDIEPDERRRIRPGTARRPTGSGGAGPSAALPLLADRPHRLRRVALHLTPRRSEQYVTHFGFTTLST